MTLRVARYAAISSLPEPWRAAFARAEPAMQFDQTSTWYEVFETAALERGERAEYVCVEDGGGSPRLCLPLRRPIRTSPLSPRSGHSLASYYTSLFAPLAAADGTPEVVDALARALRTGEDAFDVLRLAPLASDAADDDALGAALAGQGFLVARYFRFGNWYLEVAGRSYAEYFRDLPSQVRNTVTRKQKKLRAEPGVRVDIVTRAEELERAIGAYESVYAASWKIAEPHPDFVPRLLRAMAARGWLRLGVVWLGDEAIASQAWIVKDGIASIFKLAYKEQHAKLSAGSILTAALMSHAIDVDRVQTVDYLTGDDSYKRDWMSDRRERVGMLAANARTLRGIAVAARHIAPAAIRRRLNRATTDRETSTRA